MDPITIGAVVSASVAAKGAIAACRSALESADDLNSIGQHLDKIFHTTASAHKQKRKHEQQAVSHNQAVVAKRIGADADEQGAELSKIAQQKIAELEHAEALNMLARDIDNRFGAGVWDDILKSQKEAAARHRQRRKEARAAAQKKKEESRAFWHKALVESAKGLGVLGIMGLVGLFLWWASTQGASR